MSKFVSGQYYYRTDIGKVRLSNEDRVNALTDSKGNVLLIVCDGMGGSSKGDLAASLTIDTISNEFINKKRKFLARNGALYWLTNTIRKANKVVYEESQKNEIYNGMGTTLTAILISKGFYVVAQVGDSRAYTIKDNKLFQITEDQTYVGYLYRTGQISKEEMATHPKRHVLMNALGIYPSVEVDGHYSNYNQEPFLLCSDGLYNNLDAFNIEAILKSSDAVEQKVNELITIANAQGGSDNIGIVIWEANK